MNEDVGRMSTLPRTPSSAGRRVIVTALCALTLAGAAYLFRPIRAGDLPRDARALTFVDRNGALLGTILGRDDRATISVPLERISPFFLNALISSEDRRFTAHGAADPLSSLRAVAAALRHEHIPRGASTLSMQLARQLVPVEPSVWGKIVEFVTAQRLENGLSKAQILEAYANRAPMGSNVYGVEAAARTYFGIDAAHLDLAQAAFLAALPNDPTRFDPYVHPGAARERQRFILARMRANGAIDAETQRRAAAEHLTFQPRAAGIIAAAHALFFLAPRIAPDRERVRTTIDRPLQQFVEQQIRDVVSRLASSDVHDAAAIVVDNHTGQVLAYAGSPDYFDDANLGRNDGVQALRQPGSTLKPFLYELALEQRSIRPTTILQDTPVAYALPGARLYAPTDYSQRFMGPVRVRIALADSLNVPAVRVLSRVGVDEFLARLHALGFTHLTKPPAFYGLGLTLGGGEVSLYELARAYATLARHGAPTALSTTLDGSVPNDGADGVDPNGPAWAFVTDVLADPIARAGAFGTNSILSLPFPAAVKTGTSSDFRDTWTAGFTRDYTVAVWAGNFDGRPMRGISGVTGAGPLWSRIMLHLHARSEPAPFDPPLGYEHRAICATTGTRPFSGCGAVVLEWLDARDRASLGAGSPGPPGGAPQIFFPRDGDEFVANANAVLRIELAPGRGTRLTLNGRPLQPLDRDFLVRMEPGPYTLVAASAAKRSTVFFSIVSDPARHRTGFTTVVPTRS